MKKEDIKDGAYVDFQMVASFYFQFRILPWSYVNADQNQLFEVFNERNTNENMDD